MKRGISKDKTLFFKLYVHSEVLFVMFPCFVLVFSSLRAFVDARVQPIYGGTNEIMKELIARDIVSDK